MASFGSKIRSARDKLNMTLAEVAAKVGLPESSVQRYEKGIYLNPTRDLIIRFSNALAVPVIELMGWNDNDMDADIHLLTRSFACTGGALQPRTQHLIRVILELQSEEAME